MGSQGSHGVHSRKQKQLRATGREEIGDTQAVVDSAAVVLSFTHVVLCQSCGRLLRHTDSLLTGT